MIYLDSSALLKLLIDEQESAALVEWLASREGMPLVSSELAGVEVVRACRRANSDALPEARALLHTLDLVPMARGVLNEAAETGGVSLRTLAAIHLASALSIADELNWFVAYDRRLAAAASDAGLECAAPGARPS